MNQQPKRKSDKKVIILGDAGVGKTCLIRRYIDGVYMDKTQTTMGTAFFLKQWHNKNIALWDAAGQEEFQGLTSFYCRNANAAILCYDIIYVINQHYKLLKIDIVSH